MPMIPELPVAMLACARIGAAHSVVFGGFSADALRDRINDAEAKVLVTADGGWRRGAAVPAQAGTPTWPWPSTPVDRARGRGAAHRRATWPWPRAATTGGTSSWPTADADCPPEPMDSEDLLYLLYTSGTTAKPKGIMHTTGGYLTQVAFTHKYVFDLHPETDVYWCAADIGWVTGHSYIVYGPLANGATSGDVRGHARLPRQGPLVGDHREYGVTILYRAPTAIRTFMKWGTRGPRGPRPVVAAGARLGGRAHQPRGVDVVPRAHRRRPLPGRRHLVADRDRRHHDHARCPGVTTLKPGSATFPLPGHRRRGGRRRRARRSTTGGGYLTLTRPWPSMLRGIYGDPERYQETYWSRFEGRYFAGDGAKLDDDGYLWLLGRVDDVMNVSGHRISTTEVESALVDHPTVAEAAVVGANDATTGQAIIAFVTLKGGVDADAEPRRGRCASTWPTRSAPFARPKTDHLHRRPAQDPQRQDHAPAAARRGRGPRPRRHHHPGRRRRWSRRSSGGRPPAPTEE